MIDIVLSILAGTLGLYIFLRIFKIYYPWFSLVIYSFLLIIEQIIAYTLDIDLFKISILQDNGGSKYYFSSTVIPLVLTILFMLCIRFFNIFRYNKYQ
ncbi:hypothetical protein [Bacillus toyonensis]|uniref:hypothetical protein n=1 Tax=Bacillus toyonensis TaxID=155322 RepID=UPI001905ADD2|nr:hypothetical protein [Bacillus toyonensis]QQN86466.1 hypothetical protein I0K03_28895 [Bacillus toyonensis]